MDPLPPGGKRRTSRVHWHRVAGMLLLHLVAVYGCTLQITTSSVVLFVVLYVVRMFGVTAGYHCYFSHRAFRTGRVFQFLLALLAQSSGFGGALKWAGYHRHHHRHADAPEDLHSPSQEGLWYGHIGWLFNSAPDSEVDFSMRDYRKYPELDLLNRLGRMPMWGLAGLCALLGLPELCFSFALSTVLILHATLAVNSMAHLWGTRPYETKDQSRNNWFVAIIMLGGGWHNNHHHYPGSARQGFLWWEIDPTYYGLKLLELFGVVSDIHEPPASVLAARRG